jgi:hypothetical protein
MIPGIKYFFPMDDNDSVGGWYLEEIIQDEMKGAQVIPDEHSRS